MKPMQVLGLVLLVVAAWFAIAETLPGPGPIPTPGPHPVVDVAPFPADKLTVLIVEDRHNRSDLSPGHREVIASSEFASWMISEGIDWRVWDLNVDTQYVDDKWKKAIALPRDSLPWLAISNGSKGYSGALPDGIDKVKQLIGKYK